MVGLRNRLTRNALVLVGILMFKVLFDAFLLDKKFVRIIVDDTTTATDTKTSPPPRTINQTRPHPLAGARYPDGTYGFVADVTAVRRHVLKNLYPRHLQQVAANINRTYRKDIDPMFSFLPLSNIRNLYNQRTKQNYSEFEAVCETGPGKGFEGSSGYKLLTRRIQVNAPNPRPLNISNTSLFQVSTIPVKLSSMGTFMQTRRSRILCIVYTHAGAAFRLEGLWSTWAWRCDGFFAASTITQMDDPEALGFGSVDLPHVGPEKYGNMWQKTRSIVGYCHEHYLNDFEYFYILGDDTFLSVENLRNYLQVLEQDKGFGMNNCSHDTVSLYVGSTLPATYHTFAGGGSGYALNRAAVKAFIENSWCREKEIVSSEDRYMGFCMLRFHIPLQNSADAQGRSRSLGMDPNFLATFDGKTGYFVRLYKYREEKLGLGFKVGLDQVSTQSYSLHILKTPERMKRIHAILYRSCPLGTALGDALKEWDDHNIPTSEEDLKKMEHP